MRLTSKGRFAVMSLVDMAINSFIMIYDVIDAIEEELKITKCNGLQTSCLSTKKKSKCLTHNLWSNLTHHISSFLNSVSIQDVSDNSYEPFFKPNDKEDLNARSSRNN